MKQPEIKQDKEQYRELLKAFSEKTKLSNELAKMCGDRVVLK